MIKLLFSAVAAIVIAPVFFLPSAIDPVSVSAPSLDPRAVVSKFLQESRIEIELTNLAITNAAITIEPDPSNQLYFTNFAGTNCVGYGPALFHGHVGKTIKVSWAPKPGPVYLQCSSNLVDWQDIRVVNIGVTSRYFQPCDDARFFRYRLE